MWIGAVCAAFCALCSSVALAKNVTTVRAGQPVVFRVTVGRVGHVTAVLQELRGGTWVTEASRRTASGRHISLSFPAPPLPGTLTTRVELLRRAHVVWRSAVWSVVVEGQLPLSSGTGLSGSGSSGGGSGSGSSGSGSGSGSGAQPVVHTSPAIAGSGSTTSSLGQAIVNAAASEAGRPYCFDGGGPGGPSHGDGNTDGATHCGAGVVGFDCTGLTQYAVYRATGGAVNLSYHDSQQAEYAPGQWITSESALEPGDVVYFGSSRDDITHAAIYAGVVNGQQMIWDANIAFWVYPDGVYERSLASENSLGFVGAIRIPGGYSTSTSDGFEAAFEANTTSLWTVGGNGDSTQGAWNLGMMAGTSPAIAAVGNGFEVAFQANTGSLWTVGGNGDSTQGAWNLGMMKGTSPAIAALPGGGFEVAFQANTGDLWTVGTDGATDWKLGMMAGTNPAIAAVGNGFEVAFQANTGSLWTIGGNGDSTEGAWKLGMLAGTSPAIAAVGNGFEVAFQANTGSLWTIGGNGDSTQGAWNLGMMAGTSPAIAAVGNGFEVAFQANTGSVWTVGGNGDSTQGAWNLGMMKRTSPAIAAVGNGFEVAFQANTGSLWTVGGNGDSTVGSWGLGMM